MRCAECGADLPGDQTCQGRFHALLVAESHNAELARVHGLTVLTYHLQHPSLTKPWYQEAGYRLLRRSFEQGQDWRQVLMDSRRYHHSVRFQEWKRSYGPVLSPGVATGPVAGEMTIAAIDAEAPSGQSDSVLAWARSVAEGRVRAANRVP